MFPTIHIYQLVILCISAVMIYQGVEKFGKGLTGQTLMKLAIRIIIWGGMALVALFPDFSNVIAKFIGLQGNVNAVILTGFILTFLMIFKLLSAIERLEQSMSIIIRKEALKDIKEKHLN